MPVGAAPEHGEESRELPVMLKVEPWGFLERSLA
jgi:hypothetical protein